MNLNARIRAGEQRQRLVYSPGRARDENRFPFEEIRDRAGFRTRGHDRSI